MGSLYENLQVWGNWLAQHWWVYFLIPLPFVSGWLCYRLWQWWNWDEFMFPAGEDMFVNTFGFIILWPFVILYFGFGWLDQYRIKRLTRLGRRRHE